MFARYSLLRGNDGNGETNSSVIEVEMGGRIVPTQCPVPSRRRGECAFCSGNRNYLDAFLAFFSAFFSFIVLAGFFLVSFFCSIPLATVLSFGC
jgi:hypothetical protein